MVDIQRALTFPDDQKPQDEGPRCILHETPQGVSDSGHAARGLEAQGGPPLIRHSGEKALQCVLGNQTRNVALLYERAWFPTLGSDPRPDLQGALFGHGDHNPLGEGPGPTILGPVPSGSLGGLLRVGLHPGTPER